LRIAVVVGSVSGWCCVWPLGWCWRDLNNVQATERLDAGSVYLVRFGRGLPGRLGASWWGVSAIVVLILCDLNCWERRSVGRA
jgi:hypothetical protein